MWSSDDLDLLLTEQRIENSTGLPELSDKFRAKVLMESFAIQQQTQSVQRVEKLTSVLLAIALLVCLPGYYRSLREPAAWNIPDTRPFQPSLAEPEIPQSSDHYEWGLVESALAIRHETARSLARTL